MALRPNDRVQYSVSCRCGAKISLDARGFGRMRVCTKCGASITVVWGKDPVTRKNVPVAVTQAKLRGGVRADQAPSIASCSCGYKLPVEARAVTAPPNCPGCGKRMFVESKKGGSLIFGASLPQRDRPPSHSTLPTVPPLMRPTAIRRVPPKPPPPPPPATRPLRLGEVACSCGEVIPPRTSRTGRTFTCPACNRQGRVDEVRDAKGSLTLKATFPAEAEPAGAPAPPAPRPSARPPTPPASPPPFEDPGEAVDHDAAAQADDGQPVLCDCGSEIFVSSADAGQHAQCPQCGIVMLVERVRDTDSGPYYMRVRTVGRMDQDTWTLEDFK